MHNETTLRPLLSRTSFTSHQIPSLLLQSGTSAASCGRTLPPRQPTKQVPKLPLAARVSKADDILDDPSSAPNELPLPSPQQDVAVTPLLRASAPAQQHASALSPLYPCRDRDALISYISSAAATGLYALATPYITAKAGGDDLDVPLARVRLHLEAAASAPSAASAQACLQRGRPPS